jgi:hypothetical protein
VARAALTWATPREIADLNARLEMALGDLAIEKPQRRVGMR